MDKDLELSNFLITEELGKKPHSTPPIPSHLDFGALSESDFSSPSEPAQNELSDWLDEISENQNPLDDFFSMTDGSTESADDLLTKKPAREKKISQLGQPAGALYYIAPLHTLIRDIVDELLKNQRSLLSLNRSRRQALYEHLLRLGGLHSAPAKNDPLRHWLYSPKTPQQEKALLTFLEEVALIYIGQALLLKTWSDRRIRIWRNEDLAQVNWAVCQTIRPKIPVNRDGWQLTRRNLYSWYSPSKDIQKKVLQMIREWNLKDEGPTLLTSIFPKIRTHIFDSSESQGYDERFFQSLWQNMNLFGFNPCSPQNGVLRTKPIGFCPTLRDGSVIRTGPDNMEWVGLESYCFQLLLSEITLLWKAPTVAPMWSLGNGLDVHQKEQLQMNWASAKPSLTKSISEMESARIAFVSEEKPIRSQGRNAESYLYKKQVEQLPYFRKLKATSTTQGGLQACVAITKLRPGGLLWWVREEPLSPTDGQQVLKFLLEKGRLVCEWDLSAVNHSLPSKKQLFPKYIYLFFREFSVERRRENRPIRVKATGQIRSHVEVPKFLDDLTRSSRENIQSGGSWKLFRNQSPTTQQEWIEHWPGQENSQELHKLDEFRRRSLPLGQLVTIRTLNEKNQRLPGDDLYYDQCTKDQNSIQLYQTVDPETQEPKLNIAYPGEKTPVAQQNMKFLLILPEAKWITPICQFLPSKQIGRWLNHFSEKKRGKWILKEQSIKLLPIPKALIEALKKPIEFEKSKWADLAFELPYKPLKVLRKINAIENKTEKTTISSQCYLRACELLNHFLKGQSQLFKMVNSEGHVSWREIIDLLPDNQKSFITLHSEVRLSGSLPPHIPIMKIEKTNQPIPGVRFSTEKGLALHLGSANRVLVEVIWDLVKDLEHPTWNEIARGIRIAKDTEVLNSTGKDILKSHSEQDQKRKDLVTFLNSIEF